MVSFCTGEPKYFGRKMLQWTLCCELHRCRVADVCECGPVEEVGYKATGWKGTLRDSAHPNCRNHFPTCRADLQASDKHFFQKTLDPPGCRSSVTVQPLGAAAPTRTPVESPWLKQDSCSSSVTGTDLLQRSAEDGVGGQGWP